jgi:hypothetical protein
VIKALPLRGLAMMAGGRITPKVMDDLLTMVNGRFFKGLFSILHDRLVEKIRS